MRPHVCVVGDVGLDVVAKLARPVVFGQDTRARVLLAPGGAGGNTAAWLASEDLDVSLIARVGDDEAGRTAAAELGAAGIECLLAFDPTLPT
ncbi:MAG: PfkB family carbohydrate kinase, partial [Nakamurella sp.]